MSTRSAAVPLMGPADRGTMVSLMGPADPSLRVAVAGLLDLLLALRRVPVVERALTAPGMVSRLKPPHSFWVAGGGLPAHHGLGHLPALFALPRASATSLPVSLRRWSQAGSRRAPAAARPCGSTRSA